MKCACFGGTVSALMLTMGLSLSGCKVGPDYAPPTENVPSEWSDAPARFAPSAQAELHGWWGNFNDPVLSRVIEMSETNNQLLAESLANLRAAYARVGVSESQFWPSVGLAAQYQRELVNVSQVPVQSVSLEPFDLYAYGVGMAPWEIDLWGKIARQVEAAGANAQASMDDLRSMLVSVRGQVGSTYAQVRTLQQRILAAEAIVVNLQRILGLVQKQLQAGTANQLDLNYAQAQLDEELASIPPLRSALTSAMNTLAVLCGITPGPMREIVGQADEIPVGPETVSVGIPADLLRRRADVRAKERRLASSIANIGANEALHYPTLSISGNFYISATSLSGMGDISNQAYTIGPSLQWMIFQGGLINSMVAQAKAQADAALASYRNTFLSAVGDVESSIAAVVQSREALVLLNDAEANAKQAAGLVLLQYQQGLVDLRTLMSVENDLIKIVGQRIQTQGLLAQDIVGLYRALGGGWEKSAVSIEAEGISKTKPSEV
ncbi:MAG: TolC family protein [Phycisphaerales bacterium]|nr:TolC family protein [Phycisphaerales bacterium]